MDTGGKSAYYLIMDFNDILNQWEKKTRNTKQKTNPLAEWLDKNPVIDKDSEKGSMKNIQDQQYRNSKPQASIDLHGLTLQEAEEKLDTFFHECRNKKLKKVLIIHGKGIHSEKEPILKKMVRNYLEKSPYAGKTGIPSREYGGSGAVWVILKDLNVPGK